MSRKYTLTSTSIHVNNSRSIRPLMTAEERARTLTGRHQISGDGRHLVDGVPFGRPYLRHPNRPAVRIPPRKRRRLDAADPEEEVEALGLLTANGEGSPQQTGADRLANGDTLAGAERQSRARSHSKVVQFIQPEVEEDEDSDDDDDDFAPEGEQDDEDVAMDDDSDSDEHSDADSSSASDTSSDSDSDDSSSDSGSESDASSPPEVRSSKGEAGKTTHELPETPMHVAPGGGLSATRSRNSRRTRANRLRYLKEAGKLHANATLKDLTEYESAKEYQEPEPSKPFSTYSGKRKHVEEEEEEEEEEETAEDVTELEQRKHELMARFGEDTPSLMAQSEGTSREPIIAQKAASPKISLTEDQSTKPETPRKRLRPDTSAISRILARQAMPRAKKSSKDKQAVEEPPEPEGASDPDFWKSKINLSAFECWEEEFELGAPPFPFQQHWDPASKLMREKAEKKKQKKGGRNKRESVAPEEEEEITMLDYDDPPLNENPDSEVNAAIENQLRQDVATAAQADLPQPPEDISTLSNLTPTDIKEGAIIVCKFFAVNPVTIMPEISDHKTAVVEQEGDSGNGAGTFRLRIATRDLPRKEVKFDRKGNRIYGAADNLFMEDDDEEEGLWEGQFSELLEPKLLKAA
jgi:hypothetical protein